MTVIQHNVENNKKCVNYKAELNSWWKNNLPKSSRNKKYNNKYDSENSPLMVFKSIDELKEFITEHPADKITDEEQESFDSYSEYIDTIIQYIKNL